MAYNSLRQRNGSCHPSFPLIQSFTFKYSVFTRAPMLGIICLSPLVNSFDTSSVLTVYTPSVLTWFPFPPWREEKFGILFYIVNRKFVNRRGILLLYSSSTISNLNSQLNNKTRKQVFTSVRWECGLTNKISTIIIISFNSTKLLKF